MGRKCHCKADLVLTVDADRFDRPSEVEPLYLEQKTCKYDLKAVNDVVVKKKCRKLEVKGSSVGSEVIIQIYRGEELPIVYTFTNDAEIELVKKLEKGDRILFLRGESGEKGRITLKVKITKRYKH